MRSGCTIGDFPFSVVEKVRYSDTDRQGHVNNVLFAVFFEAGRVAILHGEVDLSGPEAFFVLARAAIEFRGELHWPGEVTIGSAIDHIGTSSITIRQALFQHGICAATSDSVMVHVGRKTGKAAPLTETARTFLSGGLEPRA